MKWCNTAVVAWFVGVTSIALVTSGHVDAVPPNDQQVRQWANLLGSPKFTEREDATQKLLSRGLVSLHVLEELSKNSDREVRFRSKRIVALIHDRYRASRLAAFKAGKSADLQFGELPGWTAFAMRFGDGETSRNIYADMLESEWSLLSKAYDDELTISVRELLAQRLNQLRLRGYRNYSIGTALVMYLLAADIPDEIVIHRQVNGLCLQNSELRAALAPSARRTIVRQIVGTWVAGISSQNANANICLFTAMRFQLQEGALAARRILENKTTIATIKSLAMQTLAKFGDKSQAEILETFLSDTESLHRSGKRQIRDVALACLVYMYGGDLGKVGGRRSSSAVQLLDPNSLGFATEAEREQAMQEWFALKARSVEDAASD